VIETSLSPGSHLAGRTRGAFSAPRVRPAMSLQCGLDGRHHPAIYIFNNSYCERIMQDVPRVFMSYSHDSQHHKNWVLQLATRLVNNGVDVLLDQWNLRFGSDLPHFMETGLTGAGRVLAICSEQYVLKANRGQGGVGYEKAILTGHLMRNIASDKIIPVVRDNELAEKVPSFLSSRLYVDFRDEGSFEANYTALLRDVHNQPVSPRPPLGQNPFLYVPPIVEPRVSFTAERYASVALMGTVTFDYSNNNGRFVVGAGDMLFETAWSRGGSSAIHAYTDPESIRTIALATGVKDISDISDASLYDTSSRVRSPMLGEIVIWQNTASYYLATKIEKVASQGHGQVADSVTFSYVILPAKGVNFGAVISE
jgi:hypothetical protein